MASLLITIRSDRTGGFGDPPVIFSLKGEIKMAKLPDKAKIGDAIYDVVSREEYEANRSIYGPYTAVFGPNGLLYPIRKPNDYRPGYYPDDLISTYVCPIGAESSAYSVQTIIKFSEASTMKEIIESQQKLASAERSILTTVDNVFAPEIGENDTPEMKALKQAICDKHIDLDSYEARFGPNYNNDKRLLKKERITFDKLRAICDSLDIKASITLSDAYEDTPNPIGRSISMDITGVGTGYDDDEISISDNIVEKES